MNKKSTRYFSTKQEKQVAKATGGKRTANSGATTFSKGDISTELFLLECKTTTKPVNSFSVKKEWIDKNKQEALAMRKYYSAVVIQFEPDGDNYYIIDQRTFQTLLRLLKEEEECLIQ